ncbi:hypothetical protein [Jannaschia sp. M317]|nr:hypothetical protein [Jannaschia sp. M317]
MHPQRPEDPRLTRDAAIGHDAHMALLLAAAQLRATMTGRAS